MARSAKGEVAVDPRVERTRRVVLDATLDLVAESGYGGVTIEAVAARSGVAKSTIYRQWPSRIELLNDAFHELEPPVPCTSEGCVRDRIVALLEDLAREVGDSTWSACLPALIDAAERDADARELHCRAAARTRGALVALLSEGAASGELAGVADPELTAEVLLGPIYARRLMSPSPLDPAAVGPIVEVVLGPAGTDRPPVP